MAILVPGEVNVTDGTCIAKAKTSNITNSNNLKAESPACEIMIVKKKTLDQRVFSLLNETSWYAVVFSLCPLTMRVRINFYFLNKS